MVCSYMTCTSLLNKMLINVCMLLWLEKLCCQSVPVDKSSQLSFVAIFLNKLKDYSHWLFSVKWCKLQVINCTTCHFKIQQWSWLHHIKTNGFNNHMTKVTVCIGDP